MECNKSTLNVSFLTDLHRVEGVWARPRDITWGRVLLNHCFHRLLKIEEEFDKVVIWTIGNVIKILGLYLGDDRVIESQLSKVFEEDFNLTTEVVGELRVLVLEGI